MVHSTNPHCLNAEDAGSIILYTIEIYKIYIYIYKNVMLTCFKIFINKLFFLKKFNIIFMKKYKNLLIKLIMFFLENHNFCYNLLMR